jgi:aldehyde reductase
MLRLRKDRAAEHIPCPDVAVGSNNVSGMKAYLFQNSKQTMIPKSIKLNNGREMPTIGLGTWRITDKEAMERTLQAAIKVGYRHIDTAASYENEKLIGDILKSLFARGVVRREDLFITSKLWNDQHDDPRAALEQTLRNLQIDHLDLYLIHWPVTFVPRPGKMLFEEDKPELKEFDPVGLWKEMEKLQRAGLARSIGLANFGICNTKKILEACEIRPAVDQIECHPYHREKKLVEFLKSQDIVVTSYSSLGSGQTDRCNILKDPAIVEVAERNKITPSQTILSYIVGKGMGVIPKSCSEQHLRENLELIELDPSDIERIDGITAEFKFTDAPSFGPNRYC